MLRFRLSFVAVLTVALVATAVSSSQATPAKKAAEKIKSEKVDAPPAAGQPTSLAVAVDKSVPVRFDRPAASIFIANPDIADIQVMSPTSLMVYGKKEGQTTLKVTDNAGHDLVYKTVLVSQNLADLREALRTVIPNAAIRVESIPNGIVLTGEVNDPSSIEDARRLAARYIPKDGEVINRIKIKASNQVQIRVRFAEVSKDVDKRFGINWENTASLGSFTLGLATGSDFINADTTALYDRTALDGLTNDAIAGTYSGSRFNINGMIDALAKDGLVTVLAEPSLTAISGETASFLAGGEFPVPIPQSGDTITIEWKQYGVSLAFTPTVVNDGRINLHVRPEVSQLSDAGSVTLSDITIPALTTRRAETTLELNSGQSFALAGLLNNQQTQSISKYPFLGDIPVLGPLFRSTRFQNNETELVIIITPYIVKPTTEEHLALPTDGMTTPSDTDLFFRMRQTNSDPTARTISGEARTIRVEDPIAQDSPVPSSAPVAPVSTSKQDPQRIALTPAPLSTPLPASARAIKPAPEGPGGFIVE